MNPNFVFPASERANLSDAIAERVALWLQMGLASGPLFVVRAGTGAPGDERIEAGASVIFADDDAPGVPHVRIVGVVATAPLEGYGDDEEVSPWRVTLDCNATEGQGSLTFGPDARGADSILSDAAFALLSDFEAMHEQGFVNAQPTPGAPETVGIAVNNPLTLTFEVYNLKD